jgi:hypothetical protein
MPEKKEYKWNGWTKMRKQESQRKKSFFITDYPNIFLYILCLRVTLGVGMQVVHGVGVGPTACTMYS